MPNGISIVDDAPKLTPFNADNHVNEPGYVNVESIPLNSANFSDTNFDGTFDSVMLSYKTCRNDNLGLTQIIETKPDIIVTDGSTQTIDVTVQGTTVPAAVSEKGTEFGAFDYNHKVVVPF
jgi:hypothetical protein